MRGYADLLRSTSACVHFVDAEEVQTGDDLLGIRRGIDSLGMRLAYVDCRNLLARPSETCDAIACSVGAENAPYNESNWVRFLDDMITLSTKLSGLVIVLDNAAELFAVARQEIFDLLDAFLIQVHHWWEQEKPCHLCLQFGFHPLV